MAQLYDINQLTKFKAQYKRSLDIMTVICYYNFNVEKIQTIYR